MSALLEELKESAIVMDEVAKWITGGESYNPETLANALTKQAMKLREVIRKEKGADVRPSKSKRRVLTVTESAYDTILETLEMDSQSLAFDKKLRAQIKRALYDIKEVSPKVRIDVHGGVAYVGQSSNFVEVRIVDHDNH